MINNNYIGSKSVLHRTNSYVNISNICTIIFQNELILSNNHEYYNGFSLNGAK